MSLSLISNHLHCFLLISWGPLFWTLLAPWEKGVSAAGHSIYFTLPTPSQALLMLEESQDKRRANVSLQEASQWDKGVDIHRVPPGPSSPHGLVGSHIYTSLSVIRLQLSYSQRRGLFMFLCPPMLSRRRCSDIGYPIITSHHYLTLHCHTGKEIT